MRLQLYPILILLLTATTNLAAQPIFEEADGIVRVDVESAEALGQWVLRNELSGFIGDGYLEFEGPNYFNDPGNSILNYKIRISTPGTYLFRWHSRITAQGENTEFNDSWLRCPDANLVFAERNDHTVFPHGSGMTPVPNGSGRNNWLKAYQNRRDEWFWGVFTSDNDPHDIFMQFDSPGDYTIQIAGRSTGHAIDRFVLVHSSASLNTAQDLSQPESGRLATSTSSFSKIHLKLSPNPGVDFVDLATPVQLPAGDYRVTIHDLSGRPIGSFRLPVIPGVPFRIPISNLVSGIYFLTLETEKAIFLGKFVK